jgi:parallel beta-helix repeat protein
LNSKISSNNITANNFHSILLNSSPNNDISNNKIANNYDGVILYYSSNNTISGNNITNTLLAGICLHNSSYSNLSANNLESNYPNIGLSGSSNNTIFGNNINKSSWGIMLEMSSKTNVILGNTIANHDYGIYFYATSDNVICHNNFINNIAQVHSLGSVNVWDDGCEGNYWSNYGGIDSDGDGIGDMPYSIDENNMDNHPVMNLYWNPGDVDHDLDVDLYDAVRLLAAYGYELGEEGYNPHCDIAEPNGVIDLYDAVLLLVNYGKKYS